MVKLTLLARASSFLTSTSLAKSQVLRLPNGISPSIRRSNSAAMNLFMAYQHIEPEVSLVARCDAGVCGTSVGKLKRVPIGLEDFDLFYTGARIQF